MAASGTSPVRFGIAGVGRHGVRYARHLHRGDIPGARISRVWRRNAEAGQAVAEEVGAIYSPTFEALIEADDVDAVIIAVPSGLHHRLALAVAALRKPLLLEKPLAKTTAEGRAIVEAFAEAAVPLSIGQTLRFDPLLEAGRTAAASLGRLVGCSFEQRLEPRGLAWEEDPTLAGGGVLAQTAIHAADALRFLTRPTHVEVVGGLLGRHHYPHHEDAGLVHLVLTGCPAAEGRAVFADLRVSKIGASRHHRYALFYERGGVELDFIERCLLVTEGRERRAVPVPEEPTVPQLTRAFVAFLTGGPNPVDPVDALASLAVIEDAYSAAQPVRPA